MVKSRHAAALSLFVWYLLVPPSEGTQVQTGAPLGQWYLKRCFDKAEDCEKHRRDQISGETWKLTTCDGGPCPQAVFDQTRAEVLGQQCVSGDDRRLKEYRGKLQCPPD